MTRSALLLLDQVVSKQAGVQMDLTRVYGTGHSLGSRTVQTLTHNSEAYYFAAVASTSFNNTQFTADSMMPAICWPVRPTSTAWWPLPGSPV